MIQGSQQHPLPLNVYPSPRHLPTSIPPRWTNYISHSDPAQDSLHYHQTVNSSAQRRISAKMAQMSQAELDEFQNLSDRYQADLPGPLVSEKLGMDVLVAEYAQADASFVMKTTGLASTANAYRAVKGDGQCGWRATVFGYFELLLTACDSTSVEEEKIRFETFKDAMQMIGLDYDLLSDMFDSTWELFDKIKAAVVANNRDINIVLSTMNDQNVSDSIVYHFKMITSTHMSLRADQYEPFMEMTVDEYRVSRIDPTNQEIDQIGLQALTDAIISPANIALEVLYLDRSVGSEVTPHHFTQNAGGPLSICLLYRPGHYDIIYKGTQQPQVFFAPQSIAQSMQDPTAVNPQNDAMAALFGPTGGNMFSSAGMFDTEYPTSASYPQQPPYQHSAYYDTLIPFQSMQMPSYVATSHTQSPPVPAPPPPTTMPMSAPPQPCPQLQTQHSGSSRSATMSPSPNSATATTTSNEPQIRFASTMFHNIRPHSLPLVHGGGGSTTSINHFQHPNFELQKWDPDKDYTD